MIESVDEHASSMDPPLNENTGEKLGARPKKRFDRLVFMVIDALRADFILGEDSGLKLQNGIPLPSDTMKYTTSLLSSNDVLGYISLAQTPTGKIYEHTAENTIQREAIHYPSMW